MATYLNTQTLEYPRHDGDLKLLGWEIGEPLPENWVTVIIDPIPEFQNDETCEIQSPQLIDGVWRVTYNVRKLDENDAVISEKIKKDIIVKLISTGMSEEEAASALGA